jgi:hypothetical protein
MSKGNVKPTITTEVKTNVVEQAKATETSFESVDEIVSRMMKDKNNFLVTREITGITAEFKTSHNGNEYVNVWVSLDAPIKRIDLDANGNEKVIPLETAQMPMFSLLLPFRKHKFYRKFVEALASKIEAEIGFADDAKTASFYFSGIPVKVFGQFVAKGAEERNPFQRNAEAYEIKANNRFVYHLVGVDMPNDDDTLEEYGELKNEMKAERKAAVAAAAAAAAKKAALLKRIATDVEEPF